jgi:LysR family cys regulon transcriptional activator
MNFHHLHYFREVVRHSFNLSKTSRDLYISQPALSKAIAEMEDFLKGNLFVRSGKKFLGLTELGQAVFKEVDQTLLSFERLKRTASEFHYVDEGRLVIACTHTQARYKLPPTILEFKKDYPKVQLSIIQGTPSQIAEWLLMGRADIGLASEVLSTTEGVESLPCYDWHHLLIMPKSHPLVEEEKIDLALLGQYPLITYDRAFAGRSKIDKILAEKHQEYNIVLEAMDADIIKSYTQLGLGLGIIPDVAFDPVQDRLLHAKSLSHLFGRNRAFLAIKKNSYLHQYMNVLVEMLCGSSF